MKIGWLRLNGRLDN